MKDYRGWIARRAYQEAGRLCLLVQETGAGIYDGRVKILYAEL